ncbi:hypothetical protein BGZ46_010497, partial [Entomortierella lignicola]
KGSYEIQNVEKENVHSILPIPSHTTKRRPRSSNLNAAAYSYLRAINRSHPLPSLDGDAGELNRQDYTDNGSSETNSNTFWRSTPFQLLLVNKRLASIVVQLLWGATVFHGHDVGQMESLISTLYKNDHQDLSESNLRDIERLQDFDKRKYSSYAKPGLKGVSLASSSFIMQQSTQTTQLRHHAQPCISRSEGDCQGEIENLLSTKGGSASLRDVGSSYNCSHPCHYATVTESQCECFVKDITGDPTPISNEALWPYHQLVKRVVLNFAHPQASPQLLVRALDCIKSRCQNQIQAFDLRANEKMQAAGLESVSELERLFGSGFSKLRYLRLQGGLVDNQLLGALIKGLSAPTITSCCLSQVFLGPGSVTDSAIDKLIKTAGHSIEVFAVTSCVDISGGALAGLLTKCPKLRVLSVQRSLAKDKELFEGLCIEFKERLPSLSTSTAFLSPSAQSLSQNPIIAPLERLELGTVKLTEVGVAEIIKGTCLTLRFLALEMQHFKEDFLKSTIAPLCKRLEGLYFVESDHVTQQQRQQQGMQGQGNEEQRSRRRLFDFGRSRRTLGAQHQHQQLRHHDYSISDSRVLEQHSLSRISPRPKQSPWLGETSTEEWVQYGDCALWAASTIGSAILPRSGRSRNSMDNTNAGNALTNQSLRARSFSAYFRAIGQRLVSMLSTSNSTIGQDTDALIDTENHALSTDPLPSEIVGNDYENMLKRFGVSPRTIESVLLTLQPSLKVFNAMQTDVIQAAMVAPDEIPATSSTDIVLCSEMTQRDRLETFLRLVVLLGALVIGAAASLQSTFETFMMKSPISAVFRTPELIDLLVLYLSPPDLLSCIQVNSNWQQLFTPALWNNIDDRLYSWDKIILSCHGDPSTSKAQTDRLFKLLEKYGRYIQRLYIHWKIMVEASSKSGVCTNLKTLEIYLNRSPLEGVVNSLTIAQNGDINEEGGMSHATLKAPVPQFSDPILPVFKEAFKLPIGGDQLANEKLEEGWVFTQHYWNLIIANPGVRQLQLSLPTGYLWEFQSIDFFYEVLSNLKELKELDASRFLEWTCFWNLYKHAPRLENLVVSSSFKYTSVEGDQITSNPAIKFLHIPASVEPRTFLEIVNRLPNLEELTVDSLEEDDSFVNDHISSAPTLNLKTLRFHNGGDRFELVARFVPNLKELKISTLSEKTVIALSTHCRNLEVLEVWPDPWYIDEDMMERPKSDPINLLFISCPNLRVFDGIKHTIKADELIMQSWVCYGLEKFRCRIVGIERLDSEEQALYEAMTRQSKVTLQPGHLGSTGHLEKEQAVLLKIERSHEQHQVVYSRLASLKNLKHLDLGYENRHPWTYLTASPYVSEVDGEEYLPYGGPIQDTLELSLESGLERLGDLKDLEMFGFEAVNHRITEKELDWMAKSWPKLNLMYGLAEDRLMDIEYDRKKAHLRDYMGKTRPDIKHDSLFNDPI